MRAGQEQILIPPERLNASLLLNEDLLIAKIRDAKQGKFMRDAIAQIKTRKAKEMVFKKGLLKQKGQIYVPDDKGLQ